MLHITISPTHHHIRLEGHANTAPAGQDLVCSAASILTHTLIAAAEDLHRRGILQKPAVTLRPGFAEILCTPAEGSEEDRAVIAHTLRAVCRGYAILAALAPEQVTCTVTAQQTAARGDHDNRGATCPAVPSSL